MVWTQNDLVREVRRQLVELESLRKKLASKVDVSGSLEKLVKSQRSLLHKIREYFQTLPPDLPDSACEITDSLPDYAKAYLQYLFQQPGLIQHLVGQPEGPEHGMSVLLLGVQAEAKLPKLSETCRSCGKLLFSSILAGDPILHEGTSWFHHRCQEAPAGKVHWSPHCLN